MVCHDWRQLFAVLKARRRPHAAHKNALISRKRHGHRLSEQAQQSQCPRPSPPVPPAGRVHAQQGRRVARPRQDGRTLYIKQASSQISFVDEEDSEEWVEYKIKETNMFTVDKYQQVGFFQEEKAFALRYQTAGMLETVLRAGVLGEDDTGEESPKNLKIPSRKPSIRSGVYGATLSEADTVVLLEKDRNGQLILDNMSTKSGSSTTTTVHWTGSANNNLLQFDGGYEMTLLPGGMYMGYPTDIGKIVNDMDSFHLEFCWMESPGKRQRLVRTYDSAGLAVSSTYFFETKV
ncbi:hypothetical protein OsI_13611 [Oryza sativa Indica Group]|uniref:Biogenesis factor required for ATP synthase 1-like C-terminal domain-containing protein n=1 Tax=Oryza sativa subsp. indica TaxID=39946 RepID=B8AK77_ORYSI|nr:hypothetical protein OsI_13611 [Oryza sativa Indica Group]